MHDEHVGTLESPDRAADSLDSAARKLQEHVARLLGAGEVNAARDSLEEAIRSTGRNAQHLWLLADVEFADGDYGAGARALAEAVDAADAAGGAADAVARQIRQLTEHEQYRLGLEVVEGAPGDSPQARSAVGAFYAACRCHAHAVYGYGAKPGLEESALAARHSAWLRSGGPFGWVRRGLYSWEERSLLSELRAGIKANAELESIPGLGAREAERLKTRTENADYAWQCRFEFWSLIFRWQLRLLPLTVVPVWLVLYLLNHFIGFVSGWPGPVIGTGIGAAVAVAAPVAIVRVFLRSDLTARFAIVIPFATPVIVGILAVAAEALIAEGYGDNDIPATGFWSWIVLGLITMPATSLCMLCSAALEAIVGTRRIETVNRKHCEPLVIVSLASVLHEMRTSRRMSAAERLLLARSLEWAARQVTHNLLPARSLRRIAAGDWLTRRATGWAEALRHMQRELVTPVPGGQARLEARLRSEIRCLAVGELGALAWRQPPPSPPKTASLVHKALTATRTIVVAALPLGAVLVVNAFTDVPSDIFRWTAIVGAAWCLLYATLSLDPTLNAKIETARSLTGMITDARKIR
jgi:hypothetical protein